MSSQGALGSVARITPPPLTAGRCASVFSATVLSASVFWSPSLYHRPDQSNTGALFLVSAATVGRRQFCQS